MTSRNWPSIRTTGLSEFMLLWNTVAMSVQRIRAQLVLVSVVMSVPSKMIVPPAIRPGCSQQPQQGMPRVVLPEPDSPISPTNSPSARSRR